MGTINKIVTSVLKGKHLHTPIFISINITEDAVKSAAQKLSGASGPGGTDSEALHGWLLKVREDRKRIRTSVENFVDWLANGISPWAAYCVFKFGHLIALDKQTGVRLVGFG